MVTSSNIRQVEPVPVSMTSEVVPEGTPLVWMLLGNRHGDNAQLRALDATLEELYGWRSQTKQLSYDLDCATPHRDRGTSLIGLDPGSRGELIGPWPDIVLAAGKSAASVCRWIRKKSGGKTLIVLLGRPRVAYRHFDLIVATPQYGMPQADNVVKCSLPVTWQDEDKLAEEGRLWHGRWSHLPHPWTVVMIGGSTASMNFDDAVAERLLAQLADYQRQYGGSLLVTTSPRTPDPVVQTLAERLAGPHYLFSWQPDVPNPMRAMLALADRFIVTVDSVSMLAEAANRMKPLHYFSIRKQNLIAGIKGKELSWSQRLRRRRQRRSVRRVKADMLDRLIDCLAIAGLVKPRNDYKSFESTLQRQGIGLPLGLSDRDHRPNRNIVMEERRQIAGAIMSLWQKAKGN